MPLKLGILYAIGIVYFVRITYVFGNKISLCVNKSEFLILCLATLKKHSLEKFYGNEH